MKKIISILLIICTLTLCLASCNKQVDTSSNTSSSNSDHSNSSNSGTKKELSTSERKAIAEKEILKACMNHIKIMYSSSGYNLSATKYKIGNTELSGNVFTFYITLYLYDNYGNYKATLQGTPYVSVDKYGVAGSAVTSSLRWA